MIATERQKKLKKSGKDGAKLEQKKRKCSKALWEIWQINDNSVNDELIEVKDPLYIDCVLHAAAPLNGL